MYVRQSNAELTEQQIDDGTAGLPKYFAKHGFADTDPKKIKKNGGGKGNWGHVGDEVEDGNFAMNNARRRSNSSTNASSLRSFKTKFETVEHEPVFEEELHGPRPGDLEDSSVDLEKTSTDGSAASASSAASVDYYEDEVMAEKKA